MSVEQIIDRVPEPRAVQDLVAAARTLEAEREALRETVDAIRAKIGHFAGKPIIDDMPLLSMLIEVANLVEARKNP